MEHLFIMQNTIFSRRRVVTFVCAASALLTVVFYAIIQKCLKNGFNR